MPIGQGHNQELPACQTCKGEGRTGEFVALFIPGFKSRKIGGAFTFCRHCDGTDHWPRLRARAT